MSQTKRYILTKEYAREWIEKLGHVPEEIVNYFPKKVKKILDAGGGYGRNASVLKERGFEVIVLDLNKHLLEIARSKDLKTIRGDVRNIAFGDESFDGVLLCGVLHCLSDLGEMERCLSECSRVLKNEGILLGATFYEGSKSSYTYLSPHQLRTLLRSTGFRCISLRKKIGKRIVLEFLASKRLKIFKTVANGFSNGR